MNSEARQLLKKARVSVTPGFYSLVSLQKDAWHALLADPQLSPRMSSPFMILMDQWEVTLLLDETDMRNIRPGLGGAKVQNDFRLLSLDLPMGFEEVGVMAELSGALASSGVPILAVSAFTRDHLLIKQEHLALALVALGPLVDEVC